jgi:hypothetical protein
MNKLSDILEAFHFVSGAPPGMLTAILCKDTGQIRYRSVEADLNEIDEEGIDWDAWIEIPHRNDLDLGQELVFEFVESVLPSDYERVQRSADLPQAGRLQAVQGLSGIQGFARPMA